MDKTGILARKRDGQIVLEHLDTSSMLLLYLAQELSPSEQSEVRKRLAENPALQAELHELQKVQGQFQREIAELDHAEPLIGEASAVGRITRTMRQHKVQRTAVDYKLPARHVSLWQRAPRWSYPIAAAAAVGLVFVAWWTFKPVDAGRSPIAIKLPTSEPSDDSTSDATTEELDQNLRNTNRMQTEQLQQLRQVERQVADLSQSNSDLLDGLLSQHVVLPDNE